MAERPRVLVVDDEIDHAQVVAEALERVGYRCTVATSGQQGVDFLNKEPYDLVVTDLVMKDVDGMQILKTAKEQNPDVQIVMLTGQGTIKSAVAAMREGAFTYITKPIDIEEIRSVAAKAIERKRFSWEALDTDYHDAGVPAFYGIIGGSPRMKTIFDMIKQVAPTDARVLISGESGTGKEKVAKVIHLNSSRSDKPFVGLNCAALSEGILESELFGHEKGAFTGAVSQRKGRFEYADGGTMFLDEVGDMPISTQIKLLRVIEEGEIVRVGSNIPVSVDVRILSATNRDLDEAIRDGKFREDLFYRLKVVTIDLPPLRERRADIPLMIRAFIDEFSKKYHKEGIQITKAARNLLIKYRWPGNVRELMNCIESMVAVTSDKTLDTEDIPVHIRRVALPPPPAREKLVGVNLEEMEKELIRDALEKVGGNREEAAKLLGIGERTLYRKITKYGLR